MANTEQKPDAVELLLQQHNEARLLASEVETARGDARRKAFERLVRLLAVHETAEEEVIYPVLEIAGADAARVADARKAEEDEAKKALSDLESTDIASPEFDQKFASFKQNLLRHAANEEREVFPRIRASQSPEDLRRLGDALRAAEKVAPTHPHAHGPESALGNVVVGPFVAIVDRVRDALRR
jgi:hemerythrin superfamily protein